MASWELLEEKGESELHKTRLLNVEEKPFKRITKRLTTISKIVSSAAQAPSSNESEANPPSGSLQLQEDLTHDFAAFDSSIARLQFLHDANVRERERYGADKERILGECQAAKENNTRLREQLEGARATLAQRKKFDELAEKIISNRLLRPREDQLAALAKLEDECKELERESETYSETWKERREQFNRIMDEGMHLRRQIRDEKEEVDRREGMNEGDDDEAEEQRAGQTPGNDPSSTGTPRPDGDAQSKQDGGGNTPLPTILNDQATPRDSPAPDGLLKPVSEGLGSFSRSRASTREPSTAPADDDSGPESGEDIDMEDSRIDDGQVDEGEDSGDELPTKGTDKMELDQ